ncbi:hypothetical protein L1049_018553 [Liquidambar formosana]|uniref:C3H1-type domain-containing protein n=1 Tax=Liquidambar formosana TaxID=63359 RepID=A0AAP0WM62_LIQFO
MDIKAARRVSERSERAVCNPLRRAGSSKDVVCAYWLAGRCSRNHCKFMHRESPLLAKHRGSPLLAKQSHALPDKRPRKNSLVWTREGGGSGEKITEKKEKVTEKNQETVCEYWVSGNCVHADKCQYLHSWFRGEGFSRLAQLEGHKKAITGIALPSGSDKLYTGGKDGTTRIWDCNTGLCTEVINLEGEVGSLISEGPWVFVGMPNVIKAWNIQTAAEFSLNGPVGQVHAMVVGLEVLFAGAQSCSESNSLQLAASLKSHSFAVVSLVVGGKMLYSGSMDHTIRVWDIETLQCTQTLNGHTAAVMSLLCWGRFLLSCSLDQTVKVWDATKEGNLEVTYTHNEEHGIIALCVMCLAEAKPILFCSCTDNSVHLYELPLFAERGRIFAKQEVRAMHVGPGGLSFTGDGTGLVSVWWLVEPSGGAS